MAEQVTRSKLTAEDMKARISVLETQVDAISQNIGKLEVKVDNHYATLHSRISDLRDDITHMFDVKNERIIEKLDQQAKESSEAHKHLEARLGELEKWRWFLIGGAIVIGYVLAHIKFEKLF